MVVGSKACRDVLESITDDVLAVSIGTEQDIGRLARWWGCDDAETTRGYDLTVDLESAPSRVVVRQARDSSEPIETPWKAD
ncbi:hypothetical protein [Natronobeatus ordinarius]|uniref:hypothetical protein n=1 Tax=Natronobeatus ordinarius TaxID=2963433 RepID=UPI0020CCD2B1|nr:hypothetical protein [Natronobeatus ordinarius]